YSITGESGLFDSGGLKPGAGFSLALAIPGVHRYYSTSNPAFKGEVRVVLATLPGPPGELAQDPIPAVPFPPNDPNTGAMHPRLAVVVSRTRILVRFTGEATVEQANTALQAAGVTIVGGLPRFRLLLVTAPDVPDLSALLAAAESLNANPAI